MKKALEKDKKVVVFPSAFCGIISTNPE